MEVIRQSWDDDGVGEVRAVVSSNARALSGLPVLPLPVAGEMMAQSALLLQGGDPEIGRRGFLVALDRIRLRRAVRPGDELVIRVRLALQFGPMVRFSATIERNGHRIGGGEITVRTGE